MNLRQIEAFRALMRAGSVTGAARLLHISQPSVSRLLSDLERLTGLVLFQRGPGRLLATTEAHALYAEVERSFAGLEHLRSIAEQIRASHGGQIRVGCTPSLVFDLLPQAIETFAAKHPDIGFVCQTRDSSVIADWVAAGRLHIGIVSTEVRGAAIEVAGAFSVPFVAVLPPRHPLASRQAIEPQALACHRLVSIERDYLARQPGGRRVMRDLADAIRVESWAGYGACALAAHLDAATIVDPFTADFFARHLGLVVRPLASKIAYEFSVIQPAGAARDSYAVAFVETLLAGLRARVRLIQPRARGGQEPSRRSPRSRLSRPPLARSSRPAR